MVNDKDCFKTTFATFFVLNYINIYDYIIYAMDLFTHKTKTIQFVNEINTEV